MSKEIKKRVDELSQSHTNCNLYDAASQILELVKNSHNEERLMDIINWIKEASIFEVNMNYDPWLKELTDELTPEVTR